MNEKTPENEIELEKWMKENCYNFNSYSINGNFIWEGFGIETNGSLFSWYYTERGQKNTLEIFRTEREIVEFAFNQISTDKWAKTHCIGFSIDKRQCDELAEELKKLNIDFIQDEIPYYAEQPVFRIFVFGCDIQKTEYLKSQFYDEPK